LGTHETGPHGFLWMKAFDYVAPTRLADAIAVFAARGGLARAPAGRHCREGVAMQCIGRAAVCQV
jgi:hypothetical protein